MKKVIRKIVVPVDFTSTTEKVINYALSVAKQLEAHVCFIHVTETFSGYDMLLVHPSFAQITKDMKKKAELRMEHLLEDNKDLPEGCSGKVVSGEIVEEIIKYADEEKADLVVIGTHGVKGLERVLIGSVAERVVKNSPCPVLTFNPFK